jgi:hypothetical protein
MLTRGILDAVPSTLALLDNGDLNLRGGRGPVVVSGALAVKSFLIAIFNTNTGEWGYNREFGVSYNTGVLGRYFDDTTSAGIYAAAASTAPGVAPVPTSAVTFSLNPQTRKLSATISPVVPLAGDAFDFVPTAAAV